MNTPAPTWHFFRAGGFDQVLLEKGEDLARLRGLDQKLWSVLSCPAGGLEFDPETLKLLDSDGDQHIRAPELLAAIDWTLACLRAPASLDDARNELRFEELNPENEEGARILAAARRMQETLDHAGAESISLAEAAEARAHFAARPLNGDGVVGPESTEDAELAALIGEMAACLGTTPGRGDSCGIDADQAERFFAEAEAWLAWQGRTGSEEPLARFGGGCAGALAAWRAVRSKVDDYFLRCRLAAYDSRATEALNGKEDDYLALAGTNLAEDGEAIAARPMARIDAGRPLPLGEGANPAWTDALAAFREKVVKVLLGDTAELAEDAWRRLCAEMAPLEAWDADQVETPVAALGADRLRTLAEGDLHQRLNDLIAADEALRPEAESFDEVERLLRYCRDLLDFSNNFAAFRDFYREGGKGMFQIGSLFLDGRSCDLCVAVDNVDNHAKYAQSSQLFLVYCRCVRDGASKNIVAALTAGDTGQITVGRNGLFYDRQGQDWDAQVLKVVDHPISLRQAFWLPFRRIASTIGEQLEKLANNQSTDMEKKVVANATTAPAKPADKPPAGDVARMAGVFGTLGLALGALGTAVASVVSGLLSLAWWEIPIAIAGAILAVSGPSVVIFWFKLRRRSLGPLLDASGWAVNTPARINAPFGRTLTSLAALPQGAGHDRRDPYTAGKGWLFWLALAAGAALYAWWRS